MKAGENPFLEEERTMILDVQARLREMGYKYPEEYDPSTETHFKSEVPEIRICNTHMAHDYKTRTYTVSHKKDMRVGISVRFTDYCDAIELFCNFVDIEARDNENALVMDLKTFYARNE